MRNPGDSGLKRTGILVGNMTGSGSIHFLGGEEGGRPEEAQEANIKKIIATPLINNI